MSALPAPSPRRTELPRRHLELAPSREPRLRPRLGLAVVALGGIGAILLAQLGLSIALADGAYTISALQLEQRELERQQQALAEQLESLESPQFLAKSAEALGMVASGSLPYIDLASGEISGRSTESGGSILGGDGGLVPNSTIGGLSAVPRTDDTANPVPSAATLEESGLRVVPASGEPRAEGGGTDLSSAGGALPSPTIR